jgi:hypothetical protein
MYLETAMQRYKYWVEIHTLNENSGVMHTQSGHTFTKIVEASDSYSGEQMIKAQYDGHNKEVRVFYQGSA